MSDQQKKIRPPICDEKGCAQIATVNGFCANHEFWRRVDEEKSEERAR